MLACDVPIPAHLGPNSEVFAVATDDLMHVCRDPVLGKKRMMQYDKTLESLGVLRHEGKDVDTVLDGSAVGVDLVGGVQLCANARKLFGHPKQFCCGGAK